MSDETKLEPEQMLALVCIVSVGLWFTIGAAVWIGLSAMGELTP